MVMEKLQQAYELAVEEIAKVNIQNRRLKEENERLIEEIKTIYRIIEEDKEDGKRT